MPGGTSRGNRVQSGSRCITRDRISARSSPSKAGFPVSISYSTHPNAKMSVRRSTLGLGLFRRHVAAVPRIIPAFVPPMLNVGEFGNTRITPPARRPSRDPKSSTFT